MPKGFDTVEGCYTRDQLINSYKGDVVGIAEAVFRIRNNKGDLLPYTMPYSHKHLLETGILGDQTAMARVVNKGRQEGFSEFFMREDILIANLMPTTNQYYIATKESQAKKWLRKLERAVYDTKLLPDGSRLLDIDVATSSLLEKAVKHDTNLRDIFDYSYIVGLAASPQGIRGENAINVTIDEFAHMTQMINQQREIIDAIRSFLIQGGQWTVSSTPFVQTDMFWDYYINAEDKLMTPFYYPTIENWKEIDLNKDLREQELVIPYPWISVTQLERARRDDIDHFKQEHLGIPADVMYRFFPSDLVMPMMINEPMVPDKKKFYKIAIDPAQIHDISAVTIGHLEGDIVYEDYIGELRGNFIEQSKELARLQDIFPFYEVSIDNTGMGIGLGDIIYNDFSCKLRRITYSKVIDMGKSGKMKIPEYLATRFKSALINKKYYMINHRQATDHLLRIEKVTTESGSVKYSGKRGKKRDDYAWSRFMLNMSFEGELGNSYNNNSFIPMSVPKGYTEKYKSVVM